MNTYGCGGAFRMLDTLGIPLGMYVDRVQEISRGRMSVAMDYFVYDALVSGWTFEKAIATIREAWAMEHGPKKADELAHILKDGCANKIASGILSTWEVTEVGLRLPKPISNLLKKFSHELA